MPCPLTTSDPYSDTDTPLCPWTIFNPLNGTKTHSNVVKKKKKLNAYSTSSSRHDLSVTVRRRGLRSSGCIARLVGGFVLFKCSRYSFDVSIEVDHRIEHITTPRVTIRHGGLQKLGSRCTYRTTPSESMKNVTRPSVRPMRPRWTSYALRASPDSSLNIGYYHSLSGRGNTMWATGRGAAVHIRSRCIS